MYCYPRPRITYKKVDPPSSSIGTFGADFMTNFYPFLDRRKDSFKYMVDYLDKVESPVIVETGTVRLLDDWGAGYSTVIWDHILGQRGGSAWSLDISEEFINFSRNLTTRVNYVLGDSVQSLDLLSNTIPDIDLLYLDSFDVDFTNMHPSAMHHIKELICIWHKVKPGGLIVVDDNMNGVGKGTYVADFLRNLGCPVAFDSYQIGFIKKPSY